MRFAVASAALLVVAACASSRPAPLPVPKRVDRHYAVHTFRGAELEEMRARWQLAGVAYGTGCYCMPIDVVRGDAPEGTNLSGPDNADTSLAPDDKAECTGLNPSGIEQFGRYLCREFTLGPSIQRNPGAATWSRPSPSAEAQPGSRKSKKT